MKNIGEISPLLVDSTDQWLTEWLTYVPRVGHAKVTHRCHKTISAGATPTILWNLSPTPIRTSETIFESRPDWITLST